MVDKGLPSSWVPVGASHLNQIPKMLRILCCRSSMLKFLDSVRNFCKTYFTTKDVDCIVYAATGVFYPCHIHWRYRNLTIGIYIVFHDVITGPIILKTAAKKDMSVSHFANWWSPSCIFIQSVFRQEIPFLWNKFTKAIRVDKSFDCITMEYK